MRLIFDGFDSYDYVVRYNFTYRVQKSPAPVILAAHCGGDALLLRKAL
jgi:hypothetical protein